MTILQRKLSWLCQTDILEKNVNERFLANGKVLCLWTVWVNLTIDNKSPHHLILPPALLKLHTFSNYSGHGLARLIILTSVSIITIHMTSTWQTTSLLAIQYKLLAFALGKFWNRSFGPSGRPADVHWVSEVWNCVVTTWNRRGFHSVR